MCSAVIHACCNRAVVIAAHDVPLLSKLCLTSHCRHSYSYHRAVLTQLLQRTDLADVFLTSASHRRLVDQPMCFVVTSTLFKSR